MKQRTVLTIAGSDSSGGAGIQADLKTMEALGVYGMSVITALTAQNTHGVMGISPVEKSFISLQLEAVCSDMPVDAVKIGMLPDIGAMEAVVKAIDRFGLTNVVLDPVLRSTSGTELTKGNTYEYLKKELFPRCLIITPNIPEAQILTGRDINSRKNAEEAAANIYESYGCNVLIKGGHSSFDQIGVSADLFYNGDAIWIEGRRYENPNTHGTGCTLSSAIASGLAKGLEPVNAVIQAKKYIEKCIAAGLELGHGRGPLYHSMRAN